MPQSVKPKILLIDDDLDFASDLKIFLSSEFDIKFAANTEEASRMIRKQHPECLLLDIHMPEHFGENPELEGVSFLGKLYNSIGSVCRNNTPVIVISALEPDISKKYLTAKEITGIYQKPPNVKVLKKAIWEAVTNYRNNQNLILEKLT